MLNKRNGAGFTIVELLIVIVVIAVLAAIIITVFNGMQTRARTTKIEADMALLDKAIQAARVANGETALRYITASTASGAACVTTGSAVNLADKTAAAACWTAYNSALDKISLAGGQNVRNLVDPYGRPYYIDENEKEGPSLCGTDRDTIGSFPQPRTQNDWTMLNRRYIPYITPGC